MTRDRFFSDEELTAYLDGEFELAPIDEISNASRRDRALVRRLDALRVDSQLISAAFEPLAHPAKRPPSLPPA